MTGKFKLLPGNFEQVIAGAAVVVVDLNDSGKIIAGGRLLNDRDPLTAAF